MDDGDLVVRLLDQVVAEAVADLHHRYPGHRQGIARRELDGAAVAELFDTDDMAERFLALLGRSGNAPAVHRVLARYFEERLRAEYEGFAARAAQP